MFQDCYVGEDTNKVLDNIARVRYSVILISYSFVIVVVVVEVDEAEEEEEKKV